MFNFQALTSKSWVTDYGFQKALEADPGTLKVGEQVMATGRRDIVQYWQREKSHYTLWQLLNYMGKHTEPQVLAYFDLPADTMPFLSWVYQRVAHAEPQRVEGLAELGQFGIAEEQMNYFPYAQLYALWQQETPEQRQARSGNVQVFLDRLAESDGRELLRFDAPALYQ